MNKNKTTTKAMVLLSLFFAMSMVLSLVEHSLPPIPMLPPGVKLGLSNIIVMYCLFFIGKREASVLILMKAIFVLFTRGAIAGTLSFFGGGLSLVAMSILIFIFKDYISYLLLSVAGGIAHNIGQLCAITIIFNNSIFLMYSPILIIFGVIAGVATATLLKALLPILKKLDLDDV